MSTHGALDLLNIYGEDCSSDDEVPSGRVQTKRCHKDDSDEDEEKPVKFMLPDLIKSNQKGKEYVDDPLLHEGRIRSFPHERGNWATYIYIPYENDEIDGVALKICDNLGKYNFKPIKGYHISLTKVVILRHHWINSFVSSIKESISNIHRFIILFDSLNVYCNEERTRTFIGLQIKTGYDTLFHLTKIFDRRLADFNLPEFYKNPSFHMSLVWCVGDVEDAIKNILPQLNNELAEVRNKIDDNSSWYILVDQIHCKVGNKLFTLDIS